MCRDNQIFKLHQEVHRQTIAENQAFDKVFYQLPPEQQRLIDTALGELLFATIQAAANTKRKNRGANEGSYKNHSASLES